MNYRMVLLILFTVMAACGSQIAPVQAETEVVEIRPVKISLNGNEAITVVEKGGVINTDTIRRTVKSMSENSPGLNVVQDQGLASELSSWLDKPRDNTLAAYLDKPVIKQKLDLYHLKYMVVVEHDWWGIEAQIWNLHTRELDGVIHGKTLVASSKTSCSTNPGSWIAGSVASMIYIPLATTKLAVLTLASLHFITIIGQINLTNLVSTDHAQYEPYLSISETVVQNGSEAIRGVPIPCESTHTLSSNPEIDSNRLGIYLAGKFNKYPAVAGN